MPSSSWAYADLGCYQGPPIPGLRPCLLLILCHMVKVEEPQDRRGWVPESCPDKVHLPVIRTAFFFFFFSAEEDLP